MSNFTNSSQPGKERLILCIYMHFGGYISILYFSFHLGFNSHQRTLLHVAAEESHTGLVRYLIDKGASTVIQDMSGVSAATDDRISSVYQ